MRRGQSGVRLPLTSLESRVMLRFLLEIKRVFLSLSLSQNRSTAEMGCGESAYTRPSGKVLL